ncbi:MAG: tetratricopeptide (TPR) repeat protein [Candidatus Nitrosomirales archaeon]|jgi:tetratricopeptide (TPR) repeat protein
MGALRTANEIRQAIGDSYGELVDRYDMKRTERKRKTVQLKPWKCAACGRKPPGVFRLEKAHISPLSELGITTLENLLPLCIRHGGDRQLGCHTLYDQGYCSIADMHECRKRWIECRQPTTRDNMMQLLAHFGPSTQQLGALNIKLRNLKMQQKSKPIDSEEWHYLQVQIAEVTRRRAAKDARKRAWQELTRVNPRKLMSATRKSKYFYEKGYIELLSGHLNDAFNDFFHGRKILRADSSNSKNSWRWAAHTVQLVQVSRLRSVIDPNAGWSWDKIRQELARALCYSEKATRDLGKAIEKRSTPYLQEEYRHAQRWVQNCRLHLIKPDLAQQQLESARNDWDKAHENWEKIDISSGWDTGFRPTLLSLYGKLMLESARNEVESRRALAYLVRSLVIMLGLRRQQPEGIRDLLFWIAEALDRIKDSAARRIRTVASQCIDHGSWFNSCAKISGTS